MKHLSRLAAAAAIAAGSLVSTSASAALICALCAYNSAPAGPGNQFVGMLNSTTNDSSFLDSGATFASGGYIGAFTHVWLFGFTPIGSVTTSINFIPQGGITGFNVELLSATATCGALNAACTGVSLGASIANSQNLGVNAFIPFTAIPAGMYALRITGNSTGASLYSGQLITAAVPEPGSLALAGLALVGAAAAARRARKA